MGLVSDHWMGLSLVLMTHLLFSQVGSSLKLPPPALVNTSNYYNELPVSVV